MKFTGFISAGFLLGSSCIAFAGTLTWTGDGPTRAFTEAGNWGDSGGQATAPNPGNNNSLGDTLVIGEKARGPAGPILDSDLSAGLFERITVSGPGLTINTLPVFPTLTIAGGTLQALNFNMAEASGSMGRVIQEDGRFLVRDFRMGFSPSDFSGGISDFRLEGGYLSAVAAVIGDSGEATFRQTGGQFDVGNFRLGSAAASSSGELILTGPRSEYRMTGGVLNTGFIGFPDGVTNPQLNRNGPVTEIGDGAGALFVLEGGTHRVHGGGVFGDFFQSPLLVGGSVFNPNSGDVPDDPNKHLGEYIIRDGGHLIVDFDTLVGASANTPGFLPDRFDPGNGLIRQTGGTHEIARDLILGAYGEDGSGQGQYRISGGVLDVGGEILIGEEGPEGVGTGRMSVTGGTVVAGDIRIAPASRTAGEPLISPDNQLLIGDAFNVVTSGTVFAEDVIVGGGATAGDDPTAELRINGQGILNANSVEAREGGLITGTGMIRTNRLAMLRRSFLAPGQSPGILEITGDLLLGDGSLLILEIAGRNEGDWDILDIGGDLLAEAGAGIRIDFLDNFIPDAGDSFSFFNVTGNTTQFDDLLAGGLIDVSVDASSNLAFDFGSGGVTFKSGTAQPSPIPVPASAILLLTTLGGLGSLRLRARRRQLTH